jgi:hypothetical protein
MGFLQGLTVHGSTRAQTCRPAGLCPVRGGEPNYADLPDESTRDPDGRASPDRASPATGRLLTSRCRGDLSEGVDPQMKMLSSRTNIRPETEISVSMIDHERIVSPTLRPKYSLTNQNPASLT